MNGSIVKLRQSAEYGKLPIAALRTYIARGLLNTMLRLGFGDLGQG